MRKGWFVLLALFIVPILGSGLALVGAGKHFHFDLPDLSLNAAAKLYQAPFTLIYGDCNHPLIGSVRQNSAAYSMGLRPGMRVVRINGKTAGFLSGTQIAQLLNAQSANTLTLEFHDQAAMTVPLDKLPVPDQKTTQAAIGPLCSLVMTAQEEKESQINTLPCFLKHQLKDGPLVIEIYRGSTRKFLPLTKLIAHLNRQTLEKYQAHHLRHREKLIQLMQLDCNNSDLSPLFESLNLKHNSYALFLEAGSQEYIKARDIVKVGYKDLSLNLINEQLERLASRNSTNIGNLRIAPTPSDGL